MRESAFAYKCTRLVYKPDFVTPKALAIIHLGPYSRRASSHLPATIFRAGIKRTAYLMLLPVEIARFTRT